MQLLRRLFYLHVVQKPTIGFLFCCKDLQVKRIITSKIEHHAVLYTALVLEKEFGIQIDYVNVKPNGEMTLRI
jgi:cysteine sulfinate desulfinase/cysteine desulfurase-like protein